MSKYALIKVSPPTILEIFATLPERLNISEAMLQAYPGIGWTSPDGKYRLVTVADFVPPGGQMVVGRPSYSIDGSLNVTETYSTVPIPPVTAVDLKTFVGRMTDTEFAAIIDAARQNGRLAKWIEGVRADRQVDTADAATAIVKSSLVTAGILTQPRADIIFAAPS